MSEMPEFDVENHHEFWTDMLGRTYSAGDLVAYAVTVRRSAGLTVGVVQRINKRDRKGNLITTSAYDYSKREYVAGAETCTVTILPLVDAGSRWREGREVTIGPDKIVRLDISVGDIQKDMLNG